MEGIPIADAANIIGLDISVELVYNKQYFENILEHLPQNNSQRGL